MSHCSRKTQVNFRDPLPPLKALKIKRAEPYYRSPKEHCWVSRERVTERGREREMEREREITPVRIWPSQCVQKWKAWNWIPTFLSLYDKQVRNAAALQVIPYYLTAQPVPVVEVVSGCHLPLLHRKRQYSTFSPGQIHTAYFWTTHPTPAGSLLNPSFLSLPRCQGFHPGQWERCQPHASTLASTRCHKHIVAEGKGNSPTHSP